MGSPLRVDIKEFITENRLLYSAVILYKGFTGEVQDPSYREVRQDGYSCKVGSVQSLYGMTAE